MNKKLIKVLTLFVLLTNLFMIRVSVAKCDNDYQTTLTDSPLVFKTYGKLEDNATERAVIKPKNTITTTGDALSFNFYIKDAQSGELSLKVGFNDGTKEYVAKSDFLVLLNGENKVADNVKNEKIKLLDYLYVPDYFYGYITIPYTNFQVGGHAGNITEFFIEITATGVQSTWHEDNVAFYLFDICDSVNNEKTKIVDFNSVDSYTISRKSSNESNNLTTIGNATNEDLFILEKDLETRTDKCERIGDVKIVYDFELPKYEEQYNALAVKERGLNFSRSGQKSVYDFVTLNDSTALSYFLNSDDYDASRNAYSGVHFNFESLDARDWSDAKGITFYVKNEESYMVSFSVEFYQFNTDTGYFEQYNLNNSGNKYKTMYAYNTVTGEEFSYHAQTYARIPANFEGWIRIPFSQYDAPQWSLAEQYGNKGVINFDKYPVEKISITRLFNVNLNTTIVFDNIGIYYNDFITGRSFTSNLPSIQDCLNGGNE